VKRALVGLLIVAAVLVASYLLVGRSTTTPHNGLAAPNQSAFAGGPKVLSGSQAYYSPDGLFLALLSSTGLGLASGTNDISRITPAGSHVVDAAWFPGSTALLVAEGPIPTGTLVVLGTDGKDRGTVALQPPIGFGTGHGMAISSDNATAVVTAVERPTLGPEQRYLAVVNLLTGATRPLTAPGGPDEFAPAFLDESRVAFTEAGSGAPTRVLTVDVQSGATSEVASDATLAGVVRKGARRVVAVVRGGVIEADGHRLGTLPDATSLASLHPGGIEAVIRESAADAGGVTVTRLRRIALKPIP
jgi:hypothetical protein